jgi:hypothetical protein
MTYILTAAFIVWTIIAFLVGIGASIFIGRSMDLLDEDGEHKGGSVTDLDRYRRPQKGR